MSPSCRGLTAVVVAVLASIVNACGPTISQRPPYPDAASPDAASRDAPSRDAPSPGPMSPDPMPIVVPLQAFGGLRPVWHWDAPAPASVGMPSADADGVAATFGHHGLVMLGADGHPTWQAELLGLRDVAPAIGDGRVVAATDDGVAAFDRWSGRLLWRAVLGQRASTPVMAAGTAVVSTWEGALIGLDPADGRTRWSLSLPGPSLGPPAGDGRIVVATWDDDSGSAGAVAADAATGLRQWAAALPAGGVSGPAVVGEVSSGSRAVIVAGDRRAHCLSLAGGRPCWTAALTGAGSPEVPPFPMGADVVVADRMTGLVRFDAAGKARWRRPGPGAAVRGGPVVARQPGRPQSSGERSAGDETVVLPVDEGPLLVLSGPGRRLDLVGFDGRVSGAAVRGRRLFVATREADVSSLAAYDAS